jgi:hypothetical protein
VKSDKTCERECGSTRERVKRQKDQRDLTVMCQVGSEHMISEFQKLWEEDYKKLKRQWNSGTSISVHSD